ncbi:MAG: cell wall hydrolase [Lachnospiraceae bacterium]|nr:cell wall hydrolase [Lachnospiraceae bacterium]
MKLKKIITVWLLAGLCIVGHSATAKASAEDAVISNQMTEENDISNETVDLTMEDETLQKETVVSQGAIEVVSDAAVTLVTEPAVSNPASVDEKTENVTTNQNVDQKTIATEKKVETKKSTQTKTTTKKKYTNSELRLMSCIIYAEANGEPYAGKLAVGIVVMNRKSSKSFPNTVKGVIYQKYQFGPVRNGSLNRALKEYDAGRFTSSAEKQCIKAAKEALNGTKKVKYRSKTYNMKGFYYFSTYVKGKRLTIKNHQFK